MDGLCRADDIGGVMMRYYKITGADGNLVAIGTGTGGMEITEAEYTALANEITQKAKLVAALAAGTITAEELPEDWREEIVRRAEDMAKETAAVYTQTALQAMTNEELETILAGFGISASMNKDNMVRLILAAQGDDGID